MGVLAKALPKQHWYIIQQHIDDIPDDFADGFARIVTPTVAKNTTTLMFVMCNKEALDLGMHPFVFNQHSTAVCHQAIEVAWLYDFVTSQHTNAEIAEAHALL